MGMGSREIYYLDIEVSYKKNKSIMRMRTWAVSKYKEPREIMVNDKKTMSRLDGEIYGSKYKSQKQLVIIKVHSFKFIGTSLM